MGGCPPPPVCVRHALVAHDATRRPTLDRVVTRLESESYQLTRRAPGNLVSGRNVTLSGDAPPEYRSGWGSSELHQGSLARSIGSGPTVPQTCPNRVPSGGQPCPFGGPTVPLRGANRTPSGGPVPLCARKSFVRCENWCSRPRPRQRRGWGDAGAFRLAATAPRLPNKLNHHESVANRTMSGLWLCRVVRSASVRPIVVLFRHSWRSQNHNQHVLEPAISIDRRGYRMTSLSV